MGISDVNEIIKTVEIVKTVGKPILETIATKLPSSMNKFAERMLEISEKYPSIFEFAQMIKTAAEILSDILYVLDIKCDDADVIGVKVTQSEKSVDDFESVEEYITYLKNEVELDKEKFVNLSDEERIIYTITGIGVETGVVGEKLGIRFSAEVAELFAKIAEIGKVVFDAKELVSIISSLEQDGIVELSDIVDCIKGEGNSDRLKTGESLEKAFEKIRPNEGSNVLNEIIDEIRE